MYYTGPASDQQIVARLVVDMHPEGLGKTHETTKECNTTVNASVHRATCCAT